MTYIKKSQIGKNHINAAPELTRERKEYITFSKKTREGVNKMLKFFKEVWCNDNDEQHNYLLQWFSNTLKGNKNQAIIYAKAIEGIGKSTFIDFFVQYVLGKEFYAKGD